MATHPEVLRLGYIGSYARGDWGVGSDLDMIMVVKGTDAPWELRAAAWDTTSLPVPVDLIVYTAAEWEALDSGTRFGSVLRDEIEWLLDG